MKRPLEGTDAKKGVLFKVGDLGIPDKTGKAKWSFNHVLFPRPGLTLKRHQGKHNPERYTHGGLSMAECMIPMVVLGPKVKFEPPSIWSASGSRASCRRARPLEHPHHRQGEDAGEGRDAVPASGGRRTGRHPAPQGGVLRGPNRSTGSAGRRRSITRPPDEQKAGKVVKQVTAVASYRWHEPHGADAASHGTVEIQLDTTRIRRRLDSKLDSIMGMVPAGLR